MNKSWQNKFINLAEYISEWSKDPSAKIGCVAVDPITNNILSTGYNGFPSGLEDTYERLNNREEKYKFIVHAETNCIYNATKNGINLKGSYFFIYGLCICHECAKALVQVGVEVIYYKPSFHECNNRWNTSNDLASSILNECGIKLIKL